MRHPFSLKIETYSFARFSDMVLCICEKRIKNLEKKINLS